MHLNGFNLLIAEDFEDTQELLKCLFEEEGARVTLASNGLEALIMGRTASFHAILMDLDMPEMSGIEAAQKLRSDGYTGLICALSAGTENIPGWPCDAFDCLVHKPLAEADIDAIKARLLERSAMPAPNPALTVQPSALKINPELRRRFLKSLAGLEEQLEDLIRQKKAAAILDVAHKLRGIGAMAGYPEVTALAGTVERGEADGAALLQLIREILDGEQAEAVLFDDDEVYGELLMTLGRSRGYRLDHFASLMDLDSWDRLSQYKVAIVDRKLGEMYGEDLAARIAHKVGIPVILVSAAEAPWERDQQPDFIVEFVNKTKGFIPVLDAIEHWLGLKPGADHRPASS